MIKVCLTYVLESEVGNGDRRLLSGHGSLFGGDEDILELDKGGHCTAS